MDPVSQEQTQAECSAKARVATTQVTHHYDQYGINRAIEQGVAAKASFEACMAEKGVRLVFGLRMSRSKLDQLRRHFSKFNRSRVRCKDSIAAMIRILREMPLIPSPQASS